MEIEVIYRCPICKSQSSTKEEIKKCLKTGIKDPIGIEVGTIVKAGAGYGWFDGNVQWVVNPDVDRSKHGFGWDRSMGFYYVVTSKSNNGHKTIYHLETLAMTGANGHRGGKTGVDHKTIEKAQNPPHYVTETSKPLIGNTFEHLL